MTNPLYVRDQDPVALDGTFVAAGDLDLLHGSSSLSAHDQTLHAEHEDLADPSGVLRIKLNDFASGGHNWQLSAVHDSGSGSITWTRATDHAYYDFGPLTSEQSVDVTATSDASPPATEQRRIRVKTSPTDAQPDRPRPRR